MGRIPTKNLNLPSHMRARKKASGKTYYYYDAGGKPRREIPLGCDYIGAIKQWAELEGDATSDIVTFKDLADRYLKEVIPTKASRTQADNIKELRWLNLFFNDPPAPLSSIRPVSIRQYMDWRGKSAKVRANREKALFSHIWNKGRQWGVTDLPNPCKGIEGFTEAGRDIYIEDEVFEAVHKVSCQPLKDALDLAYLTGQRPADTLKMQETDIDQRKLVLYVTQNKTKKKLRFEIVGELAQLIARIQNRKSAHKVHTLQLIVNEAGSPLSQGALRSRFEKARNQAAIEEPQLAGQIKAFQFRDIRAKAATDKTDSDGMLDAQKQLGHKSIKMTEHYVRNRRGDKVKPTR